MPVQLAGLHPLAAAVLALAFLEGGAQEACIELPGVQSMTYASPGDVVIGGITFGRDYSDTDYCGTSLTSASLFQASTAMAFAVDQVNRNSKLLPNLTLGFAMVESCLKGQTAMGHSLYFVKPGLCGTTPPFPFSDVISVIGTSTSSSAIVYGNLLNMFKIPLVTPFSSAAVLSDKNIFRYLVRTIPSDFYQAKAMVSLVRHFNWTYVSTIHSEGDYGLNGIRAVRHLAESSGICVGFAQEIRRGFQAADFDAVAKGLMRKSDARVILLFVQTLDGQNLLHAIKRAGGSGHFVMIASDGLAVGFDTSGIERVAAGAFYLQPHSVMPPAFKRYYQGLSAATSGNPWLRLLLATRFKCTWGAAASPADSGGDAQGRDEDTTTTPPLAECDPTFKLGGTSLDVSTFISSLVIDAVMAVSTAIHNYITDRCPKAFVERARLAGCLVRSELLWYLFNVTFPSSTGEQLTFDENGDVDAKYQITQHQLTGSGELRTVTVGFWDKATSSLDLSEAPLYWSEGQLDGRHTGGGNALGSGSSRSGNDDDGNNNVEETDSGGRSSGRETWSSSSSSSVPESVCSRPCAAGEFLVTLEPRCCWECRRCRANEIVVRNGSSCAECAPFMWPDADDAYKTCRPLKPVALGWHEAQTLACATLAALGLVLCLVTIGLSHHFRRERLIKATSRELSMITLLGVLLSYATGLVLMASPTDVTCYVGRFGFNLSFAIAYAPLLAKVTRIYRIFNAARLGTKPPSFVSNRSQVFLTVCLVSVQVVISVASTVLYQPNPTFRQPIINEPFVEILCSLPVEAVMIPLGYNLLLMLLCLAFAFRARKLPDNFNESRFIFVCVCTTLFLWFAFIPSYFSAFYGSQKVILLVSMILLNSAVLLMCLFFPRLYAVMYLDEERQGVSATAATKVSHEGATQSTSS